MIEDLVLSYHLLRSVTSLTESTFGSIKRHLLTKSVMVPLLTYLEKKCFPLEPMLTVDNLMKELDLLSEQNQYQFDQKEYHTLPVKVGKKN